MIKKILVMCFCILALFFSGCSSSVTFSKEDANSIIEFIEYSNNYIEKAYEENPTDDARRAIEPYRARYRFTKKIINKNQL